MKKENNSPLNPPRGTLKQATWHRQSAPLRGETTFGRAKRSQWVGLLLLLLLLVSCSTDDDAITPPAVPPATTQLQLSFGGASTYANTTPATDAEQQFESIAIFVQVGTSDAFSSHLTTKAQLINNTATITIPVSDLSATAHIIVIANYKENHITDNQLLAAHTLADIQSLRTPDKSTMPEAPLLMYYTESFDNLQTHLQTYGKVMVNLKRMAARVDLHLNLLISIDDEWGEIPTISQLIENGYFELVSARLYNPKPYTYLLKPLDNNLIKDIQKLEKFDAVLPNADGTTFTFYPYEMVEGDSPLEISILYKSRSTLEDSFEEHVLNLQLTSSEIKRNSYYKIVTQNIEFIVSDWDIEIIEIGRRRGVLHTPAKQQ